MKTGIFITVRTGSSRLPGKALKEVMGKPIISYLISRMLAINHDYGEIVICTTTLKEDDVLNDVADKYGILCYHGDNDNIIRRHMNCANAYNFDFIVNVDGDDILCDPEYVKKIIEYASKSNAYDVIRTCDLPFGTNSIGYKKEVLNKIIHTITEDIIDTGWGRLITDSSAFNIWDIHAKHSERCDCRLTLDYESDYVLFKKIIEELFVDERYVSQKSIIEYLNSNPDIKNINQHVNEKYWENYNLKRILVDKKEKESIE